MSAYNVVRMKVKPGQEQAYIDMHEKRDLADFKGMRAISLVKTGEREYLVIGEWESMDALVAARPAMIGMLDSFRDKLEDLGGDLGVTEPRSGEAVFERRA